MIQDGPLDDFRVADLTPTPRRFFLKGETSSIGSGYFFSDFVSFLVSVLGGLLGGWDLPFVIARSPEAGKRGENRR